MKNKVKGNRLRMSSVEIIGNITPRNLDTVRATFSTINYSVKTDKVE